MFNEIWRKRQDLNLHEFSLDCLADSYGYRFITFPYFDNWSEQTDLNRRVTVLQTVALTELGDTRWKITNFKLQITNYLIQLSFVIRNLKFVIDLVRTAGLEPATVSLKD